MQETAQQYTQRILSYVEGRDAIRVQKTTAARLLKAVRGLTPKQLKWQPSAGKWSIAEIIAHLSDGEIVAGWRYRSIIGESGITVQPYDQNAWVSVFNYRDRDVKQSIETFRVLRENNLRMLKEIPREVWDHYGIHLERGKESIVHLARMFAGHDANHALQIEGIVKQLKDAERSKVSKPVKSGRTKRQRKR